MEYFWELEQFDGTVTLIPPEAVQKVQSWITNGQPVLLRSALIPANQIKAFRATSKAYSSQPLLEAAAQAFHEPEYFPDGSIVARWVKKSVTNREWTAHYGKIPSYKRLEDDGAHVWVAMLIPIHDIDLKKVDYCTDEEVSQLDRQRQPRES